MGEVEAGRERVLTLQEELQANRKAVQGLTDEIALLSGRLDQQAEDVATERRWRRALVGVIGAVLVIGVFTVWFAVTTRADLRDFGERLFISSCEDRNQARTDGNAARTAQAEALIQITGADQTRPELADAYREQTEAVNDRFQPRDCQAELDRAA